MISSDITFVVQGPVRNETKECLVSIRRFFPESTIVFSTWSDSDLTGLIFDQIVLSKDPGAFDIKLNNSVVAKENTNRQIISTIGGLNLVKTIYTVKMRSDNVLTSKNFMKLYEESKEFKREDEYSLMKERVLVSSINTIDPTEFLGYVYQVSDWFFFGLTEDVKKYWEQDCLKNIEYLTNQDEVECSLYRGGFNFGRFSAEQHIFLGFLKKYRSVSCNHYRDHSNNNVTQTLKYIINNFYVASPDSIGFEFPKYSRFVRLNLTSIQDFKNYIGFWSTVITERRWVIIYKVMSEEKLSLGDKSYMFLKRIVAKLLKMKNY